MRRGEKIYSSYPAGMIVFAGPVCAAAKICGADFGSGVVHDRLERLTAACVGAMCIGLFFLIAVRVRDAKAALVMAFILATGSAMASSVGHVLWQHGGVIFWSLLAFFLEVHFGDKLSAGISLIQGVCLGMMLSCRPSAGIILAVMLAWIGLRYLRHGLLVGIGAMIGYLPWAILYESIYGALGGPTQTQLSSDNWALSGESLVGVLISPACGLLVYQPWILLIALMPFVHGCRRENAAHPPAGWMACCAAIIVVQTFLVANWICWWGGACWGSRLLSDVVPFAALLCLRPVSGLMERRWGIAVLAVIACTSALLHVCVLHLNADYSERDEAHTDWTNPPFISLIHNAY